MLSLTQEGVFHLEGMCDESPASSEEEEQRSPDEGVQFTMPNGSQSSVNSEDYSGPQETTPPQPRPQSSTTLREATPTSEVMVFDRNRSMSYPRRRRPSSAGTDTQRRLVHSLMEDKELMCESLDSGLAASSETSIGSTDSLQYSALGVSAFCIFQAVKSMLDHK